MTLDQAETLAHRFKRFHPGGQLKYGARVVQGRDTERHVYDDPKTGRARTEWRKPARLIFYTPDGAEHSIDVYASSPERALAHWRSFTGDDFRPIIGQRVRILRAVGGGRGSTPGEVLEVSPSRALVRFGYRTKDRVGERWVPFEGLGW
jgi:hypothetical protein